MSSIISVAFSGAEQVVKQVCELGDKWIPAQKYEFLANLPECNVENVVSYASYIGIAALALHVGSGMIKVFRKLVDDHHAATVRRLQNHLAARIEEEGLAMEAPLRNGPNVPRNIFSILHREVFLWVHNSL